MTDTLPTDALEALRVSLPEYLDEAATTEFTGLGPQHRWRLRQAGEFPEPVRGSTASNSKNFYRRADLVEWVRHRRVAAEAQRSRSDNPPGRPLRIPPAAAAA